MLQAISQRQNPIPEGSSEMGPSKAATHFSNAEKATARAHRSKEVRLGQGVVDGETEGIRLEVLGELGEGGARGIPHSMVCHGKRGNVVQCSQ